MTTREELLNGIVRINNERIDVKALKESEQRQVSGADSDRRTREAGESGAHAAPAESPSPAAQESLEEFAARRKEWCEQEVARVIGEAKRLADEAKAMCKVRDHLREEIGKLERILQ